MPRFRIFVTLSLILGAVASSPGLFAATHTFTVSIPRKVSPNQIPLAGAPCQISAVRLTLSFVADPQVTITGVSMQITEPDPPFNTWSTGPLTTVGALPGQTLTSDTFPVPPAFGGTVPLFGDIVSIVAPDQGGYDSTHYQRYEMDFNLYSDYVDLDKGTQQNATDTYTVVASVTTSDDVNHPLDKDKFGLCIESYDSLNRSTVGASCAPPRMFFVPISDSPATLTVDGTPQPSKVCFKERPGVDAVLVLDKSGSMADTTSSTSAVAKINALQDAVGSFVSAWDVTRSNDQTPPNDMLGAVLFDHDYGWWHDGSLTDGLHTFNATLESTINSNLASCQSMPPAATCSLKPGTSTSIGGGLLVANSNPGLTDPSILNDQKRHVIVLMTDGIQNTDPLVAAGASSANPFTISCPTDSSRCTSLPSVPGEQIYTVTVGTGLAVQPAVIQSIAHVAGGFYVNTEDDVGQLSPFFLELLQNVLKFNSYETLRLISGNVSPAAHFSASLPISTTSHDVEINLMWPRALGTLRLTITPPGGSPPIVQENADGFISIAQQIPPPTPFDPYGDWNILVEVVRGQEARIAAAGDLGSIPFNIHVMGDDGAVKSDLSIVPSDFKAGDNLRLRASVTQLGSPILGLGSRLGDRVQVDLIKPGQSIGDMLSDSQADAKPPPSDPDLEQGAEAKLYNALHAIPSPLKHEEVPGIELFDDGRPEHGDDVAGDGIYNALYPAVLPGHYDFLFSIERTDPNSVRFSRQQLRTAYVRAIPDVSNTVFQTSIQRRDRGGLFVIVMIPRVKPGPGCLKASLGCGRMGPGWANYFWFTTPGQTPFKGIDNLDGTYTATFAFAGFNPPPIAVHFENVLAVIGDSITPDHLSDPLGSENVFANVPSPGKSGKFAVFLDLGAGIPNGAFGSDFGTGFSLNSGLEYMATSHFSVEGVFGYHHFTGTITDQSLYQFSVNGKTYLTSGTFRPFVNAGIGAYEFSGGPTKFGGNVGTGLSYNFSARVSLEGLYNFHVANTSGGATQFSTIQGGVRLAF
jgi:hypothetical protein